MDGAAVPPNEGVRSGKGSGDRTPAVRSPATVSAPQFINLTHHYHGPFINNNVGMAINANLGINHGFINNNTTNEPVPPSPRLGPESSTVSGERGPSRSAGPIGTYTSDLIAALNPIPGASHTRNRKRSPPDSQCLPGTRRRVLEKICSWVDSSPLQGHPHIYWVYGYAGCGKSAISQAICEYYAEKKRLAASFFFFRGSGSRSKVVRFVATLASQIAVAIPSTAPSLENTVRNDPALLTDYTSLSSQFEHLVLTPINGVKWDRMASALQQGPFLIVLDGLDECDDSKEISAFIEFLLTFFQKSPHIPIRILITSRVESHIHKLLHSSSQVSLLNLVDHTSDSDISAALDVAIEKEVKGRVLACDPSWPSISDRQRLVRHVGGSFIFMRTIVKLLFDPETQDGLTPMDRLPLVLGTSPDFDGLYRALLAPWANLPHFRSIMSTIALAFKPLTIAQLAELLGLRTAVIVNVLVNLHAVIQVPGDDHSPVTLWHTSLRDFLCSEDRAGPDLFASPGHDLFMAFRCVALLGGTSQVPLIPSWKPYATGYAESHLVRSNRGQEGSTCNIDAAMMRNLADGLGTDLLEDKAAALETACLNGRWKLAEVFIAACAGVTFQYQFQNKPGSQSALHLCAIDDKHAIARFLLEHGADPNAKDFLRDTPLHDASRHAHVKVMQHLLEFGADPNIQDDDGWTPLHWACYRGRVEAARLLLDHNADPSIKDRDGDTALQSAHLRGKKSIIAWFHE